MALVPEAVDWANRWAELENAFAALEADRDSLKVEVGQLRRQHVDQAMTEISTSSKATAAESQEELREMRARLEEARSQAELRLAAVVEERNRSAKLSEELQERTKDLAELSKQKLQMQCDKYKAESELLPVREARDKAFLEKEEAERFAEQLRLELTELTKDRNRLFREKSDEGRRLLEMAEAAKADSAFHQKVAEEAREAQRLARQQAAALEQRLREKLEDFGAERSSLEQKLQLRAEQLERMTGLRDSLQQQLEEARQAQEASAAMQAKAEAESSALHSSMAKLQGKTENLEVQHEELLRQRVPGAESGVPPGFGSLSELVREVTSAREEALSERQARIQLQEVLQEVEREVRARYPALLSQREEAERLRRVASQLTKQNEGLLLQVQELEAAKCRAEAHCNKAERSERIIEAHARDIAKQLAILVHDNRRLNLKGPSGPSSDLQALEADRRAFRSVQDLAEQNEALRKSVARLTGECETKAQLELQTMREEQDKQVEAWTKHLEEKAEQMKALADTVVRVTKERDEAKVALEKLQARETEGTAPEVIQGAPQQGLREQLAAVREEFSKSTSKLHADVSELRTSELKARQELATVRGQLDFELSRKGDIEASHQRSEQRLEELRQRLKVQDERAVLLEEAKRREESTVLELEASLGQARRDRGQLEMEIKRERVKVHELEKFNATLLAKESAHGQAMVELQARIAHETDNYREMKRDLEAGYKREESLLREQLELSKQRQEDLQRSVEELEKARAARETEASEARARVAELEKATAKLEAKLSQTTEELHELREAGAARPRRGSEVAADAKAQLERSLASWETSTGALASQGEGAVARLEKRLRLAEEREKDHQRNSELWKSLLASHEADLVQQRAETAKLTAELETLRTRQSEDCKNLEAAEQREQGLRAKLQDLEQATLGLKSQLDAKAAEVQEAVLEGERKAREAGGRLERAERESAGAKDVVGEWQQRHREAVTAHSRDIQELDDIQQRLRTLESEARELRREKADLTGEADRARNERSEELKALTERLEQAEKHSKSLAAEVRTYQEHFLALSQQKAADAEGKGAGSEEGVQRIASEMRHARELGELKRQELELDNSRLSREAKALEAEVEDLQKRLDNEQREVLRLQAEVRLEHRAVAKLGQLSLLEDDKRRLEAEVKSLEARLAEANKKVDSGKALSEPLERSIEEKKRQQEIFDQALKECEAKADEWKTLYNEMVVKFDAHDVQEFKKLKQEETKWQTQRKELQAKLEKLQEDLKQRGLEVATSQGLKAKVDELNKALVAEKSGREAEKKKQAELQVELKNKEEVLTKKAHVDGLLLLHQKKVTDLEATVKKLQEEKEKLTAEAAKGGASAANISKLEAEKKVEQQRADKALSLAMDYQRALEVHMLESKKLEEARDESSRESAKAREELRQALIRKPEADEGAKRKPGEAVPEEPPAKFAKGSPAAPAPVASPSPAAASAAATVVATATQVPGGPAVGSQPAPVTAGVTTGTAPATGAPAIHTAAAASAGTPVPGAAAAKGVPVKAKPAAKAQEVKAAAAGMSTAPVAAKSTPEPAAPTVAAPAEGRTEAPAAEEIVDLEESPDDMETTS